MRPLLILVLSLFFAFVATHTLASSPRYSVTLLRSSYAATMAYHRPTSINDAGRVAGTDAVFGNSLAPIVVSVWDDFGAIQSLPSIDDPSATRGKAFVDINNANQVLARFSTPSGKYFAGVWTEGASWSRIEHPTLNVEARALADDGTVFGALGHESSPYLATAWFNGQSTTITMPTGGTASVVANIATNGSLAISTSINRGNGFLLTAGGASSELGTEYTDDMPIDINSSGTAIAVRVGSGTVLIQRNGQSHPVEWPFPPQFTQMSAINDAGLVVGTSNYNVSLATPSKAVLVDTSTGYRAIDLNTRISPTVGWYLSAATDVNNRGQIVGYGNFDHDGDPSTPTVRAGFRLDPIRSPGDTNYDDVVNFDDLLILAQHYGQSGNGNVFYETGDFNYDWSVNFDDLLTLAQHYDAPAQFANHWALAQTLVPEPAFISMTLAALIPRRRRA